MILDTPRRLAFTCCDIEPAVLARNVVLFSLIEDEYPAKITSQQHDPVTAVWNLFYHFFIPQSSMDILRTQAKLLLQASESYDLWLSSPYGKFIAFLDRHTLVQLRQVWIQYAVINDPDEHEAGVRSVIAKRSREVVNRNFSQGLRGAGPMWPEAVETVAHLYKTFWKTGVVGGNAKDLNALGNRGRGLVNPMFAVSSAPTAAFAVHYGTEPLLGFHVAEVFGNKSGNKRASVAAKADQVVTVAKTQFRDWCSSFKKNLGKDRIVINMFCGEALSLCGELQRKLGIMEDHSYTAGAYVKPWSSYPLVLNGFAETTAENGYGPFDVIDTSNLGDHIGLVNVLSAAAPLLPQHSYAVLYTESLLVASSTVDKQLQATLYSDVATFSLLLGLAPIGYFAGVGCEAAGYDTAQNRGHGAQQHRTRVTWISPEALASTAIPGTGINDRGSLQVKLDPTQLSRYLFKLYKNMFAHENLANLMSQLQRINDEPYSTDIPRYTRRGFVALLAVAWRKNSTDWKKTINLLLSDIGTDKSLDLGPNSLQDLHTQLYLFDLPTRDTLEIGPRRLQGLDWIPRKPNQDTGFLAQDDIPAIVHVSLVVPRARFDTFAMKETPIVESPVMHLSIAQTKSGYEFDNHFHSFDCFFGTIKRAHGTDTFSFDEDERGWLGNCDLIVSCAVPAHGLLNGPRDGIRVSLRLDPTFKPPVAIYEAGLDDTENLHVYRNDPGLNTSNALSTQIRLMEISSSETPAAFSTLVELNTANQASFLKKHIDLPQGSPESEALANKAGVTLTQSGPCTALLQIGGSYTLRLLYPFCLNASKAKFRAARKSSWVEIVVPISSPLDIEGDYWTQMVLEDGHPPIPWAIPRINIKIQPELHLPKQDGSTTWLSEFFGTSMSDAEQIMQKVGRTATPILDFKVTLLTIFDFFVYGDRNNEPVITFQLFLNAHRHTLLFANSLRHDLDLGSIVMDAYVVPLTSSRVRELISSLMVLQHSNQTQLDFSQGGTTLWKSALPALAERCRDWQHQATCEYQKTGAALSTADDQSPLCSCGEGKVGAEFHKNAVWAPFAKYATRVALMPIFPVPYLESPSWLGKTTPVAPSGSAASS